MIEEYKSAIFVLSAISIIVGYIYSNWTGSKNTVNKPSANKSASFPEDFFKSIQKKAATKKKDNEQPKKK